jgi:hypothetical protein
MSITTSQQIQRYYAQFKDNEVTFTKEVAKAVNIVPKQIYFKCLGNHWPCLIYSASMSGARLLATLGEAFYEQIKQAGNIVQIRFAFKYEDKIDPLTFFISARTTGLTPYGKSDKDINFINTVFTQKPPDSFIEIMGGLLEATMDCQKRREERIIITPDSTRRIGLKSKDSIIFIEKVPRKCILRDLSFSGAKVILIGVAKYLIEKSFVLKIGFEDQNELTELKGTVLRDEEVSGRKDLVALALKFDDAQVPIEYKMRVNQYFKHISKALLKTQQGAADNPNPDKIS